MRGKKPEESGSTTVVVSKQPGLPHKKLWLIVILVVVIAGLVLAIVTFHKPPHTTPVVDICLRGTNPTFLQDAAKNFEAFEAPKLQKDVAKIQALPNYQTDPNCLYPIVMYYINVNNPSQAQSYLDQLNKVYNAKQGLSLYLGNRAISPAALQSIITGLEAQAKHPSDNGISASGNP